MKHWLIKLLNAIPDDGSYMPRCETAGCFMAMLHDGPHREWNGLAFSTMKRKRRSDRKELDELIAIRSQYESEALPLREEEE